jgi:hypothetical protein
MNRRIATPATKPNSVVPCPCCGSRMLVKSAGSQQTTEGEAVVHGCEWCGAELTRVALKAAS